MGIELGKATVCAEKIRKNEARNPKVLNSIEIQIQLKSKSMRHTVFYFCILFLCFTLASNNNRDKQPVLPLNYDINFTLDMDSFYYFNYTVKIEFILLETERNYISLDATIPIPEYMEWIWSNGSTTLAHFNHKRPYIDIYLPSDLPRMSTLILKLYIYPVQLASIPFGFYGFNLTNNELDHPLEKMALTQFESNGAPSVFPCFDQPHFKSYFQISILVNKKYHVFFNEQVKKKQSFDNGWTLYQSQVVGPIPTYLVAWVVLKSFQSKSIQVGSTSITAFYKNFDLYVDILLNLMNS